MRVRWLLLFALAVTVLGSATITRPAQAARTSPTAVLAAADCVELDQASGSTWKFCRPTSSTPWQALPLVIVWAHGYQAPAFPKTYQDKLQLEDGTEQAVADIVAQQGYGFITTTYPRNGLVVSEAKEDLLAMVTYFNTNATYKPAQQLPRAYILIGASMGGLITAQLVETAGTPFVGAMALCGVVGNFKRQIQYWGHFNTLYRTLFADVVAGWDIEPTSVITETQWNSYYAPSIGIGAANNMTATMALISTSKAAIDTQNVTTTATTAITTVLGLTYFTFLSAQDSALRLGGNPFENRTYWYRGLPTLTETMQLNKAVPRLAASPAALAAMETYTTTGEPAIPLVVLHTTLDPIVPVDQSLLYILKSRAANSTRVTPYLVNRYGHCTFTVTEVTAALAVLRAKILGTSLPPLPDTLIRDAALDVIVQNFATAEAVPDPFTFNQLRLPVVLQGNPGE